MTAREIAIELMKRNGVEEADAKAEQRVVYSVDAFLRAKLGVVVTNDDGYPCRLSILTDIAA